MEDINTEYKLKVTEGIYKEIIAFANTDGGTIYIGVDDQGKEIGLENVSEELTRITNGIRDAIKPDATMVTEVSIKNNNLIEITVNEGNNKPYYLRNKGIRTAGVFVRQGSSSCPASSEQIREMIKEADGDKFETMRSLEQNLSFSSAANYFKENGLELTTNKFNNLRIIDQKDGLYTNLALIVSDECPYTTKVAVFSDTDNTYFKDSKEFTGSIFTQLQNAYDYINLNNNNNAKIQGLTREERYDYPAEAIREGLVNALIHRDYSYSGSTIININPTQIEFISIGGLPGGLSIDDIKLGVSQPRNINLATIFYRLHLIESYGTGIRRIMNLYKKSDIRPKIEATSNAFKLSLPNNNNRDSINGNSSVTSQTQQMKDILHEISNNGKTTDTDIGNLLNIKRARILEITKQMRELGLIKSVGRGASKYYVMC